MGEDASCSRQGGVRVVVCGDVGVGKTSLITAVATESFSDALPSVLPPTRLPVGSLPFKVPVTVIDTSSAPEDRSSLEEECRKADVAVLVYSAGGRDPLGRVSSFWLPELNRLTAAPVLLVGSKLDARADKENHLDGAVAELLGEHLQIETWLECSAKKLEQVADVFFYAQKSALYPASALYDRRSLQLKPRCIRALKRVFCAADTNGDGHLSDQEVCSFQLGCFQSELQPDELAWIKKVVRDHDPLGVTSSGLTFEAFLYLHTLFLERGRAEATWAVLNVFGYHGSDLRVSEGYFCSAAALNCPADNTRELSREAVTFLRQVFFRHDRDKDGALSPEELEDLFSTAPSCPWDEEDVKNTTETNAQGFITYNGFMAQWALLTMRTYKITLEYLWYLQYPGDPATALQAKKRSSRTRKDVFQCFVFGGEGSGKSSFVRGLIKLTIDEPVSKVASTRNECTASFLECEGEERVLVMQEVREEDIVKEIAVSAMASCDIAVFTFDSSSSASLVEAERLLIRVAGIRCDLPCVLVAAKDDLGMSSEIISQCGELCASFGLPEPLSVSIKVGDAAGVYSQLVGVALHPALAIPETREQQRARQSQRMLQRLAAFTLVGTAVAVGGMALWRCRNRG